MRGATIPADMAEEVAEEVADGAVEDQFRHKDTGEPLRRVVAKMSKTLKNVVNPDDAIRKYGADTLRLYEMYMGPLADAKPWNTKDVPGVHRFLNRAWRLIVPREQPADDVDAATTSDPDPIHPWLTAARDPNQTLLIANYDSVAVTFEATIHVRENYIAEVVVVVTALRRTMHSPFRYQRSLPKEISETRKEKFPWAVVTSTLVASVPSSVRITPLISWIRRDE